MDHSKQHTLPPQALSLADMLADRDSTIAQLRAELAEQRKAADRIEGRTDAVFAEVDGLRAQLDAVQPALAEALDECDRLRAELAEQRKAAARADGRADGYFSALGRTKAQLADVQRALDQGDEQPSDEPKPSRPRLGFVTDDQPQPPEREPTSD